MIKVNSKTVTRGFLLILLALILAGALPTGVNGEPFKKKINSDIFGVAIKGYDTVAYFTEGRAVKGESNFFYEWNDAKWYFINAEHRDLFESDPERYAPEYGGY